MSISYHDNLHYTPWRKSRIAKLEQIFGASYFKGKSVLEVGAGFGLIGKYIQENWGAVVTFTDGRQHLVDRIQIENPTSKVYLVNHERPWELNERFDFIIHWGLLYHLNKWREDLQYTVNHLKPLGVLSLESDLLDRFGDHEVKHGEAAEKDDQSLIGVATQMTATAVENQLKKLNMKFTRYDDADLNADFHCYDWKESNTGRYSVGQRRFWICST